MLLSAQYRDATVRTVAEFAVELVEGFPTLRGGQFTRREGDASSVSDSDSEGSDAIIEEDLLAAFEEAADLGPRAVFTVGPFWVVVTLGVVDGRPEATHLAIHGTTKGDHRAAPISAHALRQIPIGRLIRRVLKLMEEEGESFREFIEREPRPRQVEHHLAAFRSELSAYEDTRRQRGGAPRRAPERLLEIAESFRRHQAAGSPHPRRDMANEVSLSESGAAKALAAARAAGLLQMPSKPARRKGTK